MNTKLAAALVALVLASTGGWAAEDKATEEENTILTLVLKRSYTDGGFTVVSPVTTVCNLDSGGGGESANKTKKLADGTSVKRNKAPVRLSLPSAPEQGYLIDYDGKFSNYFKKGGGGWEQWYAENPTAHGSTTVSIPVYDEVTGHVTVCMGTQTGWLAGKGWVILYRYANGQLTEVIRMLLWIS